MDSMIIRRDPDALADPTALAPPSADNVLARRRYLMQGIIDGITRPSDRDGQRSIGPSEIGNPCDYCVGRALCRKYPELWRSPDPLHDDHFGLKAWVGTAVHAKLEEDVDIPGAVKESTITIAELADYGTISGHADLYWNGIICDYKTTDRAKLDLIKVNGPPLSYLRQINLYAYGANRYHPEMPVDQVCLLFLPRDSNRLSDGWAFYARHVPEAAEASLRRLEHLWRAVQAGLASDLPGDAECYRCTVRSWSRDEAAPPRISVPRRFGAGRR